jgi:hypothetical protein
MPGRIECRLSAFPDQLAFMEHAVFPMTVANSRGRVHAIGAFEVDTMVSGLSDCFDLHRVVFLVVR